MERCRGLRDLLAVPARELLAHRLDHLPGARDYLERLGDVFTKLGKAPTAAGGAGTGSGHDDALARQVIGKLLPCRALALEGDDRGGLGRRFLSDQVIFGGIGLALAGFFIWQATQIQTSFISDPVGPKTFPIIIGLILGAAKHGLTRRDVHPCVNLFKGTRIETDGTITPLVGPFAPAREVLLRAEMDVIVVLANCPHVRDPRPEWHSTPLRATAWRGAVTGQDDPVRNATPEGLRAFLNPDA
jgi:hypothetical protein